MGLVADAAGRLAAPQASQVVLSVPSPEALARDPETVRRVIDGARAGAEPLMITIEEADVLREEQLRPVLEATRRTRRSVILRVMSAS